MNETPIWMLALVGCVALAGERRQARAGSDGPLGAWPRFEPIGYITERHPRLPQRPTHLYGDWGAIVGEEFLFLQEDQLKLLYHSYQATHLTSRVHGRRLLEGWSLGYDPETNERHAPLVKPGGPKPGPAWHHTDTPAYLLSLELADPVTMSGLTIPYRATRRNQHVTHPIILPGAERSDDDGVGKQRSVPP